MRASQRGDIYMGLRVLTDGEEEKDGGVSSNGQEALGRTLKLSGCALVHGV